MKKSRAWTEVSLNNIKNNLDEVKRIIDPECKVMAVVKANAYGHGGVDFAKYLNELEVYDFAVATIAEAIELRKNKIKGEILILGYTHTDDLEKVAKFDLTQTVVDSEYAYTLNKLNKKIKVHVKIDTGMHRLGVDYNNFDDLRKIYTCENFEIKGTYTHLCVADSVKDEDVQFTKEQVDRFYYAIVKMQQENIRVGKLHIQSSYGVINYPEIKCDFVRIGLLLYGVLSDNINETKVKLNLKPVLALKSRIEIIKDINEGQTLGYGRNFVAKKDMKVAIVSIGYGDGVPRNLSGQGEVVLVNGKKLVLLVIFAWISLLLM